MRINAKQTLLSGLVALIIVSGYYRWNMEKTKQSTPVASRFNSSNNVIKEENDDYLKNKIENESEEECFGTCVHDDYFSKLKRERENSRSESMEALNKIIENNSSHENSKNETQKQITRLTLNSEKESIIENLIRSKDYSNAIVYLGEKSANVIVKTNELDALKVAQIKEIVSLHTDVSSEGIKISCHD